METIHELKVGAAPRLVTPPEAPQSPSSDERPEVRPAVGGRHRIQRARVDRETIRRLIEGVQVL